jgi:hypothetical protein
MTNPVMHRGFLDPATRADNLRAMSRRRRLPCLAQTAAQTAAQTTARTAALAAALSAALAAAPARAEVLALLVGVSDYHVLDADLRGPRNDVRLMAETLLARGADPARIAVLTSPGADLPAGIAPAADPTRAAILAALAGLAAQAGPGDTVLFYFSGHGSQAPDTSGDEAGGYDEILLPSDAAGWKGQVGAVENALVDDELQVAMQAVLDTGAELVAILDACHSATGLRAAGGQGVARYVAPEALGIPPDAPAAGTASATAPLTGRFAFLYAAQSDERAFEYPLGDPADPANWYGDFTRGLAQVMADVPDLTWAQALAASAEALRQEQASQTPDGEGTALDAAVFGAAAPAPRLRVDDGVLRGGLLAGLSAGAEVTLYDRAAGGIAVGRATVGDIGPTQAALQGQGLPAGVLWAEVTAPGVPPEVVLGRVPDPVVAAVEAAGLDGARFADTGYDIGLVAGGGTLAVTGRDGVLDPDGPGSSPRIALAEGPGAVAAFLDRAVRAVRLQAALARAGGKPGLSLPGAGLKVTAERHPAAPGCGDPGPAQPLRDGDTVAACDEVWLALANGSTVAQDVTVLYLDRDLGLTALWPDPGASNRIGFGETQRLGLRIVNPDGRAGVEQIVVIAVPARDGAPRTVLTRLADDGTSRAADAGAASPTEVWLAGAAGPDGTSRAAGLPGPTEKIKVTRLRVQLAAGTD